MSTYGYITLAALEIYTGINYGATSATYTDAFVNGQISLAERFVNAMCVSAPGVTDGSYAATMILSERFMRNVMVTDGFIAAVDQSNKAFFDYLLDVILKSSKYNPVDIVDMSGADR